MKRCSAACVLALLASASLHAQTSGPAQVRPLTDPTIVATGETNAHILTSPDLATLGQREFLVTWDLDYQRYSGSQLVDWGGAISGRRVSLQGQPTGDELVLEPFENRSVEGFHRMAADQDGRFAILWWEVDSHELLLRRFASDGSLLETTRLEPDPGALASQHIHALAMTPAGRPAAAWSRAEQPNTLPDQLWMQFFDATATPAGDSFRVSRGVGQPALAMSRTQAFFVGHTLIQNRAVLTVQRFDTAGRPLGQRTPVVGTNSIQTLPAVAANADGRFVVAWTDDQGVGARIFDASGQKIGPVIRVTRTRVFTPLDIALDARGNFVVVWQVVTRPQESLFGLRARVFNREGVPQGGESIVDDDFSQSNIFLPPGVALTEAGTFLTGWSAILPDEDQFLLPVVKTRAYGLLRDDDRCVWRDGTFLCDTAYDGDPAHQQLRFGAASDIPLLADFDGDGIDNPCVRRGTAFRCAREGRPDLVFRFGSSQHTPLVGDVDGDGDDDPCVRRGRAFLCDTAHNGGLPEVNIPFGIGADEPVLGDVDGDGDDDPCVWRELSGTLFCDTTHDGSADESSFVANALPGDRPLLGDLDGDGHADFCLARDESLLCDLDRDGIFTEETFVTKPRDVLLLGNVDGV